MFDFPVAASSGRAAYVAGTFDTKGRELYFLRQCLERQGLRVVTVDLSTSGKPSTAAVHPREVARHHPEGESAVFSGDRGGAVTAMALAFERFVRTRGDLGGLIGAGGSGGTTLATAGMRALPVGVPKVMVSTVASGNTRPYVGPSDICMMYSVTDVQGIHRISERVLANAAHALAGMIAHPPAISADNKPALGLTMFGVTTPCVQAVVKRLDDEYDCLVFHATGIGGQSMEKLVDSGLLAGVIDVTTTEVADELVGGVLSAGPTRLDASRASRALRRLLRRARHGEFRRLGHGAGALQGPAPLRPQPARDADAHHGRGDAGDRRLPRRQAQRDDRAGALPAARGRRLVDRSRRASRSTTPRPTGRCSRRSSSASAPAPIASSSACR